MHRLLLLLLLTACAATPPATAVTDVAPADLPAAVMAAVQAARPGLVVTEAQLKLREGRRYYDVGGRLPDGDEVELDLLAEGDRWTVVEIQRDIPWAAAPEPVRAAATPQLRGAAPVRVIESAQINGVIIYELFAAGRPATPALEVKWEGGAATLLTQAWPH